VSAVSFIANDREYVMPDAPVVVICIDGSEPEYHERALAAGRMPWLQRTLDGAGRSWPAECAMPALTNPNNLSIATGRPPSVHGISGNYLFDAETGEEVLMNDPRFLRAPTLFAAASAAGADVAVVTAKDKLRRLLGTGLVGRPTSTTAICFSAEKADEATLDANGIDDVLELVGAPVPAVYSAELSEFALRAGVALLRTRPIDLLYVSLTDYIQHKNAPGTAVADDFYAMIDRYAAEFDELGAIVVLTADHGMSAKTDAEGNPRVVYLESEIRRLAHRDGTADGVRVILPINAPYTVHHGALGTIAYVHLDEGIDVEQVAAGVAALPGIEEVRRSDQAAQLYDLPADRIGDLVVIAQKDTALGRFEDWHDLTQLREPLRSHGGLGEQSIPFLINRAIPDPRDDRSLETIHNYDAFWVGTTLVAAAERHGDELAHAEAAR
jgi:phosphonoacetate hydrolase